MYRLIAALLLIVSSSVLADDKPIYGFASPAQQQKLEAQFDSKLNRDNLRNWMQRLSARPHHLGSDYDRQNAEFIASLFRSWGYDTNIEEFPVLFPPPRKRLVELVAPEHYTAKLFEPPVAEDKTSNQPSEQLPVYNAYSIVGGV